MKQLNRIIGILLSVMLIFGMMSSMAVAEETEAAETEETVVEETAEETPEAPEEPKAPEVIYGEDAIGLLGVLEIAEIAESELGDKITRAEILKMFCLAAGYSEMKSDEVIFSDLPLEHEYEPYIKALVKIGVIDGAGQNGKIFPDGQIGLTEAAAIAVKLIGFGPMAEARGGYPTGYLSIAKSEGILKGLPASQSTVLTKGMAAKLIENMLNSEIMVQSGFGSEVTYEVQPGSSLLWSVFGVKYLEGVVTGVDISRVAGPNTVTPFHVDIDGFEIEAKDVENPRQYLGYKVDAYYTDDRSDIPKLVWIEKSIKNTEYIFSAEDTVDISDGRVVVETEDGNDKRYSYNKSVPVIYNGTSTAQPFSMALIEDKFGNITLVDNDGDKSADVAILDIYETYVVSQVNLEDYIIYDKYDSKKKIELNTTKDEPYVIIYDGDGVETTLSKISEGSVVCVFSSAPDAYQQYVRAHIVSKTAQGTISRTKNGGKTVIIDGKEYELTEKCRTENSDLLKTGQSVKLYMDYAGNVVYVEKLDSVNALEFGYVIAVDEGKGLGGIIKLKLFNTNQNVIIAELADRVRVDGIPYDGNDKNVAAILREASHIQFPEADKSCSSQILKYTLDGNGRISIIDTILKGNTEGKIVEATRDDGDVLYDSLFSIAASEDDYYENSNKTLGPKIAMNNDTLCMLYPSPVDGDVDNMDLYSMDSVSNLLSDDQSKYNARAFYNGTDEYFASFLGCVNKDTLYTFISSRTSFAVVDEYLQMYNKETGDIEDCLKVYSENGEETIKSLEGFTFDGFKDAQGTAQKMTVSQLKRGDMIRYRLDKYGYIRSMIFYHRVDGDIQATAGTNAFRGGITMRKGIIYDKFDGGFVIFYPDITNKDDLDLLESKDLSKITYNDEKCELIVLTGATPVYYNYEKDENGEVEVGLTNLSALRSYKDTGTDCSRIFIQTYYGVPEGILIY